MRLAIRVIRIVGSVADLIGRATPHDTQRAFLWHAFPLRDHQWQQDGERGAFLVKVTTSSMRPSILPKTTKRYFFISTKPYITLIKQLHTGYGGIGSTCYPLCPNQGKRKHTPRRGHERPS